MSIRPHRLAAVVILLLVGAVVAMTAQHRASYYGIGVLALLTLKLGGSMRHRPVASASPGLAVAAVIPFYNEDPTTLRKSVESVLAQSYPLAHIVVVDDGSTDTSAREALRGLDVALLVQPMNLGKREALARGFRHAAQVDAYVCIDSDTILEPNAVEEVVKPFADDEVKCVTGLVMASNYDTNLLTRLIDLRYANAFLYERAAYSALGSVLCACGSLALYRADVVHDYLDDFLTQRFLGKPAIFGDDRRLTNYALLEGRAVLQETAVAWTTVPERMGHFVRQQARWNKSFWRESLWVVRNMSARKPAMWLSLIELTSWTVFTAMLLVALILAPLRTGAVGLPVYLGYLGLLAYARSVRFFDVTRREDTRRRKLTTFALAPVYGFLHIGLLLPLRLYSLITITSGTWGTRDEVEVAVGVRPEDVVGAVAPDGATLRQQLIAAGLAPRRDH